MRFNEQDEFAARVQRELEASRTPESRDTWGAHNPGEKPPQPIAGFNGCFAAVGILRCQLGSACRCGPDPIGGCMWAYVIDRNCR